MTRPPFRPEPVRVSLADVYAMDFGLRKVDLPLWAMVAQSSPGAPYCEVGVGDGRASAVLGGDRYGIDIDRAFVCRAREKGVYAVQGDAADHSAWGALPACCGMVFCAYSTLFLIPHDRQVDVLRNMRAALRPGGVLAVEVFVPSLDQTASREGAVGNPNGVGPLWTRRTDFTLAPDPDGLKGTTRAVRRYGPDQGEWRMELDETIYWRTPAGLVALFDAAGLPGVALTTYSTLAADPLAAVVPLGSVLATWTRPMEDS